MKATRKYAWLVGLLLALLMAGCGTPTLKSDAWNLPMKENAQSAMIIGRIDLPDNATENPKGEHLYLERVVVMSPTGAYICGGYMPCGETNFIMNDKNYFVVPNLKPGKYYIRGFTTGDVYNSFPVDDKYAINLKAGEILFVGSFDYLDKPQGTVSKFFGMPGSFGLRPAKHPTETEILHWLEHAGKGTGWEGNIRHTLAMMHGRR